MGLIERMKFFMAKRNGALPLNFYRTLIEM